MEDVAVKIENPACKKPVLKLEISVLKKLTGGLVLLLLNTGLIQVSNRHLFSISRMSIHTNVHLLRQVHHDNQNPEFNHTSCKR